MSQHEILDGFYCKLEENGVDEEFINSLNELILNDDLSKDNLINLIEGVFDG